MLPHHKSAVERFIAASKSDARIVAAALYGSNAQGTADEYSDLDLAVITTDEAFDDFVAQRDEFVRLLGDPLFVTSFDNPNFVFCILADGTDIELMLGHISQPNLDTGVPYQVLLDKQDFFAHSPPTPAPPASTAQEKTLRDLITWFWHDLSHFIAAMGRGQLWWAYGQLDILRMMCVNLARFSHDFSDPEVGQDPYFKLDKTVPPELLTDLQSTFCPMERAAMLRASHTLLDFYRRTAVPLAETHGIEYPFQLDRILSERLDNLPS